MIPQLGHFFNHEKAIPPNCCPTIRVDVNLPELPELQRYNGTYSIDTNIEYTDQGNLFIPVYILLL